MVIKKVRVRAPAKINLSLEVIGRRGDGFHEIDTVMTTVSLFDNISIESSEKLSINFTGPYSQGIDPANDLAGRAAIELAKITGREPNVAITIEKQIPSSAGLGGGSSDAAAVLRGLNKFWDLNQELKDLEKIASKIGSDVTFFLYGGTARCTGRGEKIHPLKDLSKLRALILLPEVSTIQNKTATLYSKIHASNFTDGSHSKRIAYRVDRKLPPPTSDMFNVFETVIKNHYSELIEHYELLRSKGAIHLHLCGSGPAVYLWIHRNAKVEELSFDFMQAGASVFEVFTTNRQDATAIEILNDDAF
tara:strand:- start:32682 stop:33596 length:915 start_codon:yes stop_codon:yes gene_type:complete